MPDLIEVIEVMEKFVFASIIILFIITGLILFIKDVITAVKNPNFEKQGNKYYVKPSNSWHGMTNYHSSNIYDSSSSCDSGSFDSGGDCGGTD